jgi:hypothetical protein
VRATGQGIATTLWVKLDSNFPGKIFLDVQTEFDLHDLDLIVQKTKLFVLIVTNGIFDSPWCKIGKIASY